MPLCYSFTRVREGISLDECLLGSRSTLLEIFSTRHRSLAPLIAGWRNRDLPLPLFTEDSFSSSHSIWVSPSTKKIRKINHPDEIDSERKNKSCTNHFPPSCESAPPPPTESHHISAEKSLGKKSPNSVRCNEKNGRVSNKSMEEGGESLVWGRNFFYFNPF